MTRRQLIWQQRAKSKWDKFGDKTSAFYFKSAKGRSARNEIKAIKDTEGNWISDQSSIKSPFLTSFKELYQVETIGENGISHEDTIFCPITTLSQNHIDHLNAPFTNKEIRDACFSSKPLKSPGSDGTPPIFFQKNWNIVSPDVMKSVQSFLDSGFMLKEQNKNFITLIPKKDGPHEVKDFRRISLCNTSYKIISKTLVNRLKTIMGDLVDKYQNAFVPGRQMADNCFISHEITNWVRKRKKGNSFAGILKVDLSKAYDRIKWDFVEAMLRKMQFPEKWISWIMQCITTVSYSVLVNGEPSKNFIPSSGLRQGDPLSSYIFILCLEVLSKNLSHLQETKELEGLKIARNAPKSSHLFSQMMLYSFSRQNQKIDGQLKKLSPPFARNLERRLTLRNHTLFLAQTPLQNL